MKEEKKDKKKPKTDNYIRLTFVGSDNKKKKKKEK